jgi:hypothetical protein
MKGGIVARKEKENHEGLRNIFFLLNNLTAVPILDPPVQFLL